MEKSIRKETREKFDALLKNALKRKEATKSTQSLISDDSSISIVEENDTKPKIVQQIEVDVHDNKSYILDKFLNDANIQNSDDNSTNDVFIKPPIPKPRRKKISSIKSNETYKIEESIRKLSIDSSGTYCVEIHQVHNSIQSDKDKMPVPKQYDSDADINTRSDSSTSQTSTINKKNKVDHINYENETKSKSHSSKKQEFKQKTEGAIVTNDTEAEVAKYCYEQIASIIIHRTDFLDLKSIVIHPIIKIHIVNGNTGEYLKKTDDNRSVIFHYDDKKISYILPILTQPYDLQKKRMLYPVWEETILVNEDFSYILHRDNNTMLFFELIDFMSFTTASATYSQGKSNGWHKIAWAFLKLNGKNNSVNINNKARLQFYEPGSRKIENTDVCEPYIWWLNKKLQRYPSTLYVTIKGINPQLLLDSFSIKHNRKEKHSLYNEEDGSTLDKSNTISNDKVNWDKLLHKKCHLPNVCLKKLESYDEGCFIAKFSHSGKYLAYSVLLNGTYTVIVYSIEKLEETFQFPGHQNLIYSIRWSDDDKIIVTASADSSVCMWNVEKHTFLQMLPHPSFVYCAEITSNFVIITGCYDQTLRIWTNENNSEYYLLQEIKNHNGYITSICCNKKGNLMYSADSVGVIIQWSSENKKWTMKRKISVLEIKGIIINNVLLHKREKRLLIHTRDNNICLFNVKSGFVIYWLQGIINNRFQVNSCFSNCGTYVFSGSDNGTVSVWNAYTGKLIGSYNPYSKYTTISIPIHCVDFHPHKDILCITNYGKKLPILLYEFDNNVQESEVNFKFKNVDEYKSESSFVDKCNTLKRKQISETLDFKGILNKMNHITDNHS